MLEVTNHRRDRAQLKYVYPVLSRRAHGVSIGINLNTNQTCNWRCIYCQVPGLTRGMPQKVDLERIESELRGFLQDVLQGDFWVREQIAPAKRQIRDISISGDGEATLAPNFPQVIDIIGKVRKEFGLEEVARCLL
ncbi:MAG: hypothetical protein ACYYK0_04985 [Candidatus Eutrophobiaceae bacterium]